MGINVLIAGDSPVMRKILERSLRQAYPSVDSVVEAADSEEALAKLESHAANVILSDINMPQANGLELLQRLQESPHKDVPVILVTTDGSEKTVMEAISLGAKGYVRKPFTSAQIQAALAKVLV